MELMKELAKERPEIMKMNVVTSIDDEGNAYNKVKYAPSVGYHDGGFDYNQDVPKKKCNAVCLN